MLYASLLLSSILLLIVIWAAYRSDHPVLTTVLSAAGFTVLPVALSCVFPAVAMQSLLLVIGMTIWRGFHGQPRSFVLFVAGATLLAYSIAGGLAFQQYARLREQFPYDSMEARLPLPKASLELSSLPPIPVERLESLEDLIENLEPLKWRDQLRREHLEQLHEHAVRVFVGSPGFGSARMVGLSEWTLKYGLRTEPPLPQPGFRSTSWSTGASEALPFPPGRSEPDQDLSWFHSRSVVDFVNAGNFGFFKDRRHVAGFQSHQFSRYPTPAERWTLQTLDLVGLVLHDEPLAYVSTNLPRMDELREAPTRELDDFETAGLALLRRGEEMHIRKTAAGARVLGALRSVKQCVSCHGGQRGDLLGAFSYTFTSAGKAVEHLAK